LAQVDKYLINALWAYFLIDLLSRPLWIPDMALSKYSSSHSYTPSISNQANFSGQLTFLMSADKIGSGSMHFYLISLSQQLG